MVLSEKDGKKRRRRKYISLIYQDILQYLRIDTRQVKVLYTEGSLGRGVTPLLLVVAELLSGCFRSYHTVFIINNCYATVYTNPLDFGAYSDVRNFLLKCCGTQDRVTPVAQLWVPSKLAHFFVY